MQEHNLAYIDKKAKIGKDVTVGPFTSIQGDVIIEDNTWIGSNVTIMDGARIGKNCKIFSGAVISAPPQDLKFDGERSKVIIGNDVTIRECVTVNRGTKATYKTVVGNNTLLMAYSHIAHDCIIGENCVLANVSTLGGHVSIEDYAILGGIVAVHQFVHIGAHSMISGGSLVRKDVPPFTKAAREPLSFMGVNSIGLRRRSFSNDAIQEIQEIYRIIYQRGNTVTKALEIIESEIPASTERDEILVFIQKSSRGIMRGFLGEG